MLKNALFRLHRTLDQIRGSADDFFWLEIRCLVNHHFGIALSLRDARRIIGYGPQCTDCTDYRPESSLRGFPSQDSSFWCWAWNKLQRAGISNAGRSQKTDDKWEKFSGATLHVAFVGVYESEEHWRLLRCPEIVVPRKNDDKGPQPVRSGISRTNEIIQPIDSVAQKVVAWLREV